MDESNSVFEARFVTADVVIFLALMISSLVIGILAGFRGWRSTTTKDFFVGGRNMLVLPVTMSLLGGVLSALSVLGNGTEMYYYGTQLWMTLVGCFFGILVVIFIILPVLYPLDLVSMMQYLEMRFHSRILKKATSIALMISMTFYLGVCYYAPSLILSSFTNLPHWIAVVGPGLLCTVYITIGGVRGIVYTDVLQTSVMFIGVAAVAIYVSIDVGGIQKVFEIAEKGHRLEFFNLDFDPTVRHTFWSVSILGLYFIVSSIGISQAQFQRLASVNTLKKAQFVCVLFFIGLVILWSLFYYSGLVAYAAYYGCDPLLNNEISKNDQIIPFLVADKLTFLPGMAGLFAAAVYGALLSSVSTQANSFAALIWEDFFADWKWFLNKDFVSPTNFSRILSALASLLGIGIAFLVGNLGTLFQVAYSLSAALTSPTDGLFMVAITAPWVNKQGAVWGFILSFVFNVWLTVARIVYGAGQSVPLPVSLEMCPDFNQTSSSLQPFQDPSVSQPESSHSSFYDVSYCYLGSIGVLNVYIISTLVSLITGVNSPDRLSDKLVHPFFLKIYRWFWNKFHKSPTDTLTASPSSCSNSESKL